MAKMWFQYFQITESAKADWLNLCGDNAYAVVNANRIPAPLPSGLLEKCDTALVLRSGSLGNGDKIVYIMANLNRIDGNKIDQMPFAIGIISGSNFTSGTLAHHGSYDAGRTSPASPTSRSYVTLTLGQQAKFANNFSFQELPMAGTGSLASLGIQSQINALNTVVAKLQSQLPRGPIRSVGSFKGHTARHCRVCKTTVNWGKKVGRCKCSGKFWRRAR
jgi:hypothetical protein